MSATARRLEIDEIAGHLDQIRATVIGRIQRGYPKVAREDLEDAYGDLCAEALSTSFGAVEQLEAWVQRALRRDAIDIRRSARNRTQTALEPDDDSIFAVAEPDRALAGREARGLLHEFFASLPGQDRLIAYLYHEPGWGWKPERIAAATGIPVREVRRSVDRNGTRLRRFRPAGPRRGTVRELHHREARLDRHWRAFAAIQVASSPLPSMPGRAA